MEFQSAELNTKTVTLLFIGPAGEVKNATLKLYKDRYTDNHIIACPCLVLDALVYPF